MQPDKLESLYVPEEKRGVRLDVFISSQFDALSRSGWKGLIQQGALCVNGKKVKPNYKLRRGDLLNWTWPVEPTQAGPVPEKMALEVLYEDAAILVLNKPAGLVVHPGAGHEQGTLVSGLLFHDEAFARVERAGVVHRLDKDTSGVMVVAKTTAAMVELQRQFKARETEKEYAAIVWGAPRASGRIETQIGRHRVHRQKMCVLTEGGREAISNYVRKEQFQDVALMQVGIETGRTHQIRVHMAHIGHPIVGDRVYGRARKSRSFAVPERQMLHAAQLSFNHPVSGKRLSFEAPLFKDMAQLLACLRG